MQCAIDSEQRAMKQSKVERIDQTVTTRLAVAEHDWLHDSVYCRADNRAPRFRMPDLLSACVSLVIGEEDDGTSLLNCLVDDIARRPSSACRSCDIWLPQFDLLLRTHRAAWNDFPHPKFELAQLTTACVVIARTDVDTDAGSRILARARQNFLARMRPARDIRSS